ncbi:MAG TPA: MFS transporter [Methylomirabilota bacterium]|nr:MFS transporter [Methylomirabilota bacterium]
MPVLLAALGVFAVSLDSAINIALPAMAATFGVGAATIRWIIICYVLTYALTSFAAGLLADRLGPAPVFTTGLGLSCVGFVAYAAAGSFGAVLLLRVLQGIGGGLVYGTAPALVTLWLPRERHGRGLGLMSLGLGAGLAVGPLMGGVLVERFGWLWVFLARAPVMGILALLAGAMLGTSRRGGIVTRMVAPRDVLRAPVLRSATLAFLSNYAQFAVWLLIPFFLVGVLGLPPIVGGLLFMLTPLGAALAAPAGGWATDRAGPRPPLVLGLLIEVGGLWTISRLGVEGPLLVAAVGLALVGLGVGLFQVPNLAEMMAAFPSAQQGAAGGLAFLSRTVGSAAGVQVTATLFASRGGELAFLEAFRFAFVAAATACGVAALLALVPTARPTARP